MSKPVKGFRSSHASDGYGNTYVKVYESGYYKDQWRYIEKPILQDILQQLREKGFNSCLDFACGTGRITEVEASYFDTCYGVDVSESMLDQARQRASKSVYIKQDLTRELLNRKFSVVTAFRFFLNAEHDLRQEALNAIAKMLEDDGCLVANIHANSSSILGYAYRLRNWLTKSKKANTLGRAEFIKYLANAGFSVEKIYMYSYLPRIGWFYPQVYASLMSPVERMQKNYSLFPKSLAQCFIVVARKTKC